MHLSPNLDLRQWNFSCCGEDLGVLSGAFDDVVQPLLKHEQLGRLRKSA